MENATIGGRHIRPKRWVGPRTEFRLCLKSGGLGRHHKKITTLVPPWTVGWKGLKGAETQVDRLGDIQDSSGTCDRLAMGAQSGRRDRDAWGLSGC